jgi:hypothetical protein
MPDLTRRADPHRTDCWLVYFDTDVHVGTITRVLGNLGAEPQWKWWCGFYPGPGDQREGTATTFEAARAEFEAAWQDYLSRCTPADFQAWRDQQAWTKEKYRRFDRGEPMPPDWRPARMGAG